MWYKQKTNTKNKNGTKEAIAGWNWQKPESGLAGGWLGKVIKLGATCKPSPPPPHTCIGSVMVQVAYGPD